MGESSASLRRIWLGVIFAGLVPAMTCAATIPVTALSATFSSDTATLSDITVGGITRGQEEIILPTITHCRFNAGGTFIVPQSSPAPPPGQRAAIMHDLVLNSGITNIGSGSGLSGPLSSGDAGLALQFDSPVTNQPGPDLVVLVSGNKVDDNLFVSLSDGSASLLVVTSAFSGVLLEQNVQLYTSSTPITSLAMFESASFSAVPTASGANWVFGAGIDLSDLGVPASSSIQSLMLQDSAANVNENIDLAGVYGLAVVPEPAAGIMVVLAAAPLVRRKR